jgi:hypothetical protein
MPFCQVITTPPSPSKTEKNSTSAELSRLPFNSNREPSNGAILNFYYEIMGDSRY